jgi:hypothetical protein
MDVSHFGLFDLSAAPPRRIGHAVEEAVTPAKWWRTRRPAMQHAPRSLFRLILGQRLHGVGRHPGQA